MIDRAGPGEPGGPLVVLCALLLASALFLPSFSVGASLPLVRPEEPLVFAAAAALLIERQPVRSAYLGALGLLLAWAAASIALNGRLGEPRDLLELYKGAKMLVLFCAFRAALARAPERLSATVAVLFLGVAAANLAQFLDLFGWNARVAPLYSDPARALAFEESTYRRVLGLMANPNDNGVCLLFFATFFFARVRRASVWLLPTVAALLLLLLSQSRTGVAAAAPALAFLLLAGGGPRSLFLAVPAALAAAAAATRLGLSYLDTLWTTSLAENPSLLARYAVWAELAARIRERPVAGYGANKDFFYSQGLYADSEYLLTAFRYGLVGVALYLVVVLGPAAAALRRGAGPLSAFGGAFCVAAAIAALTNNPLTEPRLLVLFLFAAAAAFSAPARPTAACCCCPLGARPAAADPA